MAGFDRFNKSWADDGVLGDPSTPQSDAGFAFLGQAPPTVELFNSLFRWNDEKDNYLYNQMASVFTWGGQTAADDNPDTLRDAIASKFKRRLTANADLYVATTGNDSNAGTVGSPFLTLQKAWDYIVGSIDLAGYTVTIHVADGTYTTGLEASGYAAGAISPNSVQFVGNTTTPSNVTVNVTNDIAFAATWGGQYSIRGFKILASGTGDGQGVGVYTIGAGSYINYGVVEFGACGVSHVYASAGTQVVVADDYTISGNGGQSHWSAYANGNIITSANLTITLTGTPTFTTAFAFIGAVSILSMGLSVTFTGSATGSRYLVNTNGVAILNGNTLPGNSVGSTATGGQVVA